MKKGTQRVFPDKKPIHRKRQTQWILLDSGGLKQWDLASRRYDDAVEEALCDLGYQVVSEDEVPS